MFIGVWVDALKQKCPILLRKSVDTVLSLGVKTFIYPIHKAVIHLLIGG